MAIETSGRRGSVAVALGDEMIGEVMLSPTLRHAVELMPAVEKLCREAGWMETQPKVEQVYLSLGPGSFTGLRIAVAIARAMAQASGCLLVGVPSLEVIAENAPRDFGTVVPILDAKRGQVFAARYQRDASGELVQTAEPALIDPAAFLGEAITHSSDGRVAVLGEGVEYHRAAILAADGGRQAIIELDRDLWFGRAATVHRLGWRRAQRQEFSDPRTLLPIYIRLPEAEEVWRKKHAGE